ncbi:MAG: hypothetical protein PVI88_07525 [Nitrosopumilaceae archaeon]|jgi:hypothetical protein
MHESELDPLHPIKIEDYPKLFDYVLTAKGLVYFNQLKRSYFLQKKLTVDEYDKLRLLYIYYSTANKNTEEVSMWKKICVALEEKGIYEKEMYLSKQDLINQEFILENPDYTPGLYKQHIDFLKKS